MKKLLNGMLSITFAAIMCCTGCVDNGEGEQEMAAPASVPGAQNCYPAATSGGEPVGLNAMLVYYLAKNYKDRQLQAINSAHYPGSSDARSVWFDMETLKRFIHEIESQTCGKCDNSDKMLGVRIYYGAYPDSTKWTDSLWANALAGVPMENAGKHTVMMVPTYRDISTQADIDFDPDYVTDGCDFTNIESFYNNMKTQPPAGVTLSILSTMNGTAQNHGQLIPPPYDRMTILDNGAGIMYAVDTY